MDTIGTNYYSTELCANYQNISSELIASFIGMLISTGTYSVVAAMFTSSKISIDTSAGISVMALMGITTFTILFTMQIGISENRYAELWESLWGEPTNNSGDITTDDEEKESYIKLVLKSIHFAHTPSDLQTSAVFLRHDYQSSVEGTPEWESNTSEKNTSDVLYIADNSEKIKVSVVISVMLKNQSYSGKIYAEAGSQKSGNGILGNLVSAELTANSSGDYTLDFELSRSNFQGVKIGKYYDYWTWRADGIGLFASTTHNTWILETSPLEQWAIDEENEVSNISVRTLNILNDIRTYDSSKEAGEIIVLDCLDGWLRHMVHFIQDSGRFSYNYDEKYKFSLFQEIFSEISFNIRGFECEYYSVANSEVKMSSLDATMLMQVVASLLGLGGNVVFIHGDNTSESDIDFDESTNTLYGATYIYFDNVGIIGGFGPMGLKIPQKHFLLSVERDNNIFLYDSVVNFWNGDEGAETTGEYEKCYLYSIKFTDEKYAEDSFCTCRNKSFYRESITPIGASAFCSSFKTKWRLDNTSETINNRRIFVRNKDYLPETIGNIVYENGKYILSSRTEKFNKSLKTYFIPYPPEYPIIAHKISYAYITDVLVSAANQLIATSIYGFKETIVLLSDLIFGNGQYNSGIGDDFVIKKEVLTYANFFSNLFSSTTHPSNAYQEGEKLLNSIAKLLTVQSYFNLKKGNNRWNASIGENMDLENNWAIYVPYKTSSNSITTVKYQCECGDISVNSVSYQISNYSEVHLYISDVDAYRIRLMNELYLKCKVYPKVPKIYYNDFINGRFFVSSCSNMNLSFDGWGADRKVEWTNIVIYNNNGNEVFRHQPCPYLSNMMNKLVDDCYI